MALQVRRLHPLFVGDVSGVDLSASLSDDTVAAIDAAINTHAILVFHDQRLDDDSLLALGRRFGGIEPPRRQREQHRLKHAELADISNLTKENRLRDREDRRRMDFLGNQLWHADASFRRVPGVLSMLYAHVIPPSGGETEFADLRAAYDALPSEMKARVDPLVAEHSIFHSRGVIGFTDYSEAERASLPAVPQRLVRVHPGSKRRTLYMGAHASHILGWPVPEGRLLLRDLMDHATQRAFVHSHAWRVGDLVIWDNRCTMHRGRPYDDATYPRDLRRVTTMDVASTLEQVA